MGVYKPPHHLLDQPIQLQAPVTFIKRLSVTINQALVHTTGEDAIEHVTKILDNLDEKKDNKKKPFQTENNHQAFVNSVKSSIRNNN